MPALCSKDLEGRRQGRLVRFQGRMGGLPPNCGHSGSTPGWCFVESGSRRAGNSPQPAKAVAFSIRGCHPAAAVRSGRRSPLSSSCPDRLAGGIESEHGGGMAWRVIGNAGKMAQFGKAACRRLCAILEHGAQCVTRGEYFFNSGADDVLSQNTSCRLPERAGFRIDTDARNRFAILAEPDIDTHD